MPSLALSISKGRFSLAMPVLVKNSMLQTAFLQKLCYVFGIPTDPRAERKILDNYLHKESLPVDAAVLLTTPANKENLQTAL
jgi:hypothetical protein